MFREDYDISDEEFESVTKYFDDDLDNWMDYDSIVNEFVAFYIASGIKHHALWKGALSGHINGAVETLSGYFLDKRCNVEKMKQILKEKYKLEVTNDNPLELKIIK